MTSSPPPGLLQITLHGSQSVVGSSQAPEEEEEKKRDHISPVLAPSSSVYSLCLPLNCGTAFPSND